MEVITKSAPETQKLGQKVAAGVRARGAGREAAVFALYGQLGSGKTTFVRGLAKGLGLPHRILSPTFIIVREYPLRDKEFRRFYHIDLYRTQNAADFADLGFSDIFQNPAHVVVIEWADRLGLQLPKMRTDIFFSQRSQNARQIIISPKAENIFPSKL